MKLHSQKDVAQSKAVRERLSSLRNKVEIKSFKPTQECQCSTPFISSSPPYFLQSESLNKAMWITAHYVRFFPKLFCLIYTSLTSPCPQVRTTIKGFQDKFLVLELVLEFLPSLSLMPSSILALEGKQQEHSCMLGDFMWWFYAEKSLKLGVRNSALRDK